MALSIAQLCAGVGKIGRRAHKRRLKDGQLRGDREQTGNCKHGIKLTGVRFLLRKCFPELVERIDEKRQQVETLDVWRNYWILIESLDTNLQPLAESAGLKKKTERGETEEKQRARGQLMQACGWRAGEYPRSKVAANGARCDCA